MHYSLAWYFQNKEKDKRTCLVHYHASRPCSKGTTMVNRHHHDFTARQQELLEAISKSGQLCDEGMELAGLAVTMGLELAELSSYISDLQWLLDNGYIEFVDGTDRFRARKSQPIMLSESSL